MNVSHHNTDIQLNTVIVGDLKMYFSARGGNEYADLEYFVNMKTGVRTEWHGDKR